MLPTMPLARLRSMWISCNMPFSTSATRVSIGVTLIRISSLMAKSRAADQSKGHVELPQQRRRLEQGQADDAAVAAAERLDEHRGETLDPIAARLVQRFAGVPVACQL